MFSFSARILRSTFRTKRAADDQKSANPNPASQIGAVHITQWDTGTFQAGKIARFDGARVVADIKSRAGTPQGQLKAPHIESEFAPTGEISKARALDDVQ